MLILKLRKIFFGFLALIAVAVLPGCRLIPLRSPKTDNDTEIRKLLRQSAMLQESGDYVQAEICLTEAVALNAKDAESRRSYAELLWQMSKKQESVDQLSQALTLTGKPDTRILLSLSEKCYDLGHYETAVECAEKAIDCAEGKWIVTEENRSLLSRAWVIRARVRWRNNELQPALDDYYKAISLCPKNQELLSELATLQMTMKRPEQALATWHSVSKLWPLDQEPQHVVFGRGNAYMAMQQYHLACDQFEMANRRWPEDINTYCRLAEAQLACGRAKEALVVAKRAIEIAPQNPTCLAMHEQVRVALGQQRIR